MAAADNEGLKRARSKEHSNQSSGKGSGTGAKKKSGPAVGKTKK